MENRAWYTQYRGSLAIHASSNFTGVEQDAARIEELSGIKVPQALQCGAVVGVVCLTDCRPSGILTSPSLWALPRQAWWYLAKPQACRPFDVKGKLGLWEVDDKLVAEALAQIKR